MSLAADNRIIWRGAQCIATVMRMRREIFQVLSGFTGTSERQLAQEATPREMAVVAKRLCVRHESAVLLEAAERAAVHEVGP